MGYAWKLVRFYPETWRTATQGMSRDQRSVYFDLCMLYWDTRQVIPEAELEMMIERDTVESLISNKFLLPREGGFIPKIARKVSSRQASLRMPTHIWQITRQRIFERDNFTCQYCGSTENLECDHHIPLILDGSDDDSNLITACRKCNRAKCGKPPEDFLYEQQAQA